VANGEHRARLTHRLLEKEVLDGSEIDAIVKAFGGNGVNSFAPSVSAVA